MAATHKAYSLTAAGRRAVQHDGAALTLQVALSECLKMTHLQLVEKTRLPASTVRRRISLMLRAGHLVTNDKLPSNAEPVVDARPLEEALRVPRAVQPLPGIGRRVLPVDGGAAK